MKKERYDYICSLGSACLCASALRDAELRLMSGPFDWLSGPKLLDRVTMIERDFEHWFDLDDFEAEGDPNKFGHDTYFNRRTGIHYPHDFPCNVPIVDSIGEVAERYRRRIARFYGRVRASKRVLFVWVENPLHDDRPTEEEVNQAVMKLRAKFADVEIDLLVIDRASPTDVCGAFVRKPGFYRTFSRYVPKFDYAEELRPWDISTGPLVAILKAFEVADYRTKGERRAHRAANLQKKWNKYGAKGHLSYLVSRLQVKIAKLLLNRLRRKGVELKLVFESQFGR